MSARERADADDMDIVLDGHAGGFVGLLEERADVDIEAEVGEGGGDDLGSAVVAVLAHFGEQDARAAAVVFLEGGGEVAEFLDLGIGSEFGLVNAAHGADDGLVALEGFFERIGNFAECGAGAGGFDGKGEQVAFACGG